MKNNTTKTPEPQALTKEEETIYRNFKTGLAIFLFMAILGAALDQII